MAEDSDLEKTESPSPRRLEQAREAGQAPHSRELSSFAVMLSAGLGLSFLGQNLFLGLRQTVQDGLIFDHGIVAHPERMLEQLGQASQASLLALLPWLSLVLAVAVAVPLTMSGFLFSSKNFMPDFTRLSPARGLGNIFSSGGLSELLKAILKAVLLGGMAGWYLWNHRGTALALGHTDLERGISDGTALLLHCMYTLLAGMAVVVAIDVPFQLWRHHAGLMMTRDELRQEAKESDGDPHVKARIRQQQREASRRRMMAELPKADVVVTNPTHYAVALRYEAGMRAPRVIAKGGDLVALRIRGVAEKHHIPILEQPPLARALFRHTDLEQEIPPILYAAVAEVLAYIFQLRAFRDGQGSRPATPAEIAVPAEVAVPAGAPQAAVTATAVASARPVGDAPALGALAGPAGVPEA